MAGRPPLPTNLKVLRGTFRKHRGATSEAMPDPEIPPVPAHLSDEAKVEWGRVSESLFKLGLLSGIDRAVLAAYCEHWSDWVDASRMCASKEGNDRKVIRTAAGNLVENPYFSIKKRSAELMHKFAVELGMTPAARSRINADSSGEKKPQSPWAKFGS